MEEISKYIISGIITLVIGSTIYTFTEEDVINNFSQEANITIEESKKVIEELEQEADNYYEELGIDPPTSFKEVGEIYLEDARVIESTSNEINCNEEYYSVIIQECNQYKSFGKALANAEIELGNAYIKLDLDSAEREDIEYIIQAIDNVLNIYDKAPPVAKEEEFKRINSALIYNKSFFETLLQSTEE